MLDEWVVAAEDDAELTNVDTWEDPTLAGADKGSVAAVLLKVKEEIPEDEAVITEEVLDAKGIDGWLLEDEVRVWVND